MDSPTTVRRPSFATAYPKGVQLSESTVAVMEKMRKKRTAITFDEITLEDKPSDLHPNDVSLKSFVTRKIALKGAGLLSAAMDTVTEGPLALAIARVGGMGILHRNMDPKTQASMVKWVRRKIHYRGMIDNPITYTPDITLSAFQKDVTSRGFTFTSFPIVDETGLLLGLLTRDELDFVEEGDPTLRAIMKPRASVITAPEGVTTTEQAYAIMKQQKVKKLPIVNKEGHLVGMYVWNDVREDQEKHNSFSLDEEGHFLVGAAVGLGAADLERVDLLVEVGCKVVVLDSSHGACQPAREQIKRIKSKHGEKIELIVGNIASYDSAMYLLEGDFKPDALKVGIGPGSICTTRSVTGTGVPQVTAVYEVWRAIRDYGVKTGYYIPIIADGGIRTSGDIVKCFAVGASGIMLGSVFAGTAEAPGQVIVKDGKKYKFIRGMGSRSAMEERSGSRIRYDRQTNKATGELLTSKEKEKIVPEGVEGLVEFKGSVDKVMTTYLGGIQAGLSHTGAIDVPTFSNKASFWFQGTAGIVEGRPHDIQDIRN
jgi:IMP dehydrogenase